MIRLIYESGWSQTIYFCFHILGFASVLFFNIWYSKKYRISKSKALSITIIAYSITYIWIYILCWAETGFKTFGGNNIVRGFVYIPIIVYPLAKLFKIDWRKICDYIAPCVCLSHGISHLGCVFAGCCSGYACSWGIYNPIYGYTAFPSQIFEAITALAIFVLIIYITKKRDFNVDGKSYPLMLVLFGTTRFIWEFVRNNRKIWLRCSSLAFHALFMAIIGTILLIYISKNEAINKNRNTKNMRRK